MRECSYPAGQQQPGAVGCSVVCEAYSDSIFGQLVRIGGAHDVISFDLCIGNLENAQGGLSVRSFSSSLLKFSEHVH